MNLLHNAPRSRKPIASGTTAWFALLLIFVMGCDPANDGATGDAARSGASSAQAKGTQAWLLYGVADNGAAIVTRIERSKPPPMNLGESDNLGFSITKSGGMTARQGRVLVTDRKHVLFGEVDGPASSHRWDAESPVMWIPLGDAPEQATVSLTRAGTPLASIAVPSTDRALHASDIVEEISVTGPPESRINIVIISDGYTANEAAKFRSDSDAIADFLLSTRPYDEYRTLFNVHRIVTESPESGADHPDLGIDVLNRFGTSFDCGGIGRALCANDSLVLSAVFELLPETDQVLLLVNDERYGGAGGQVATSSTHVSSPFIAVHEFGHSLAKLADEYEDATGNEGVVAPEANVSLSSEFDEIKWNHWIDESTLLPTLEVLATSNVEPIGAYEGARYHSSGIFRPAPSCKMRESESELCAVCVEASVRKFHAHSSLILSVAPVATEAINIATRTAPIEFQVELTELPDLEIRWLVDGEEVGTGPSFSLDPSALSLDAKTLQVQVAHTTELVRSDPTGSLSEEIEWDLGDGIPEEEPDDADQAGCGCQQSPNRSTGLATGLLLLGMTWRNGKSRKHRAQPGRRSTLRR